LEFILIDQDTEALSYCHESLNRVLIEHEQVHLPIELHCLHFSVRQILKPRGEAEKQVVEKLLSDVDLVYAAGLLDYLPEPVAQRLMTSLYQMLAPGGRLFIGNLKRVPDSTFMMEFILDWHLEYRTPEIMLALGEALRPEPAKVGYVMDDLDNCIFLDVEKPV
jgi:extracellular factor (EF) 3-hydroxypalmitic acid methyl ester biosynthesis protein